MGHDMNKSGYPVEWRGQTLYLSDRTDKVKQGFCAFTVNRMLDNARKVLRADHYYQFERSALAHLPNWTTIPDPEVVLAFAEPDADVQMFRLHLDATANDIADAELREIIRAKESDPESDYMRALKLIEAQANPKVSGAYFGSQAPTDGSEPKANSAGQAT